MARSVLTSVENNFVNGLVTEATGLNFPENAVTETDNCVFSERGVISRRRGFDFEDGFLGRTNNYVDAVFNEYLWESVSNDGNITLLVQQTGFIVSFFRVGLTEALSSSYVTEINLANFTTQPLEVIAANTCQFTAGFGYLFVTHPVIDPFYIEFDSGTNSVSAGFITVRTRDFVGIGVGGETRLTTLSVEHYYNLQNQGWTPTRILNFHEQTTFYPSDYDVWWLYKNAAGDFVPGTLADKIDRGNSTAPKGSFIFDEFFKDRGAASDPDQVITVESSAGYRPSTCEFFAGRVFYSGVNFPTYSNKIYFSQIVQGPNEFGQCHSENDPTAEISSDLLPSDGGVIQVPDAGTIYKLWSIEGSLMVFASNGIWQISGSTGLGFTANDYLVRRLSTIRTLSPYSFVDMGGLPAWWTNDGIYTISVNAAVGSTQVTSLSNKNIKRFFDTIPAESKKYAKGAFNIVEKKIQWVYRDTSPDSVLERFSYNKVLNFNVQTGAFYDWTLPDSDIQLKGLLCLQGDRATFVNENVLDQNDAVVVDQFNANVTVGVVGQVSSDSVFKYVISYGGATLFTYADVDALSYTDWDYSGAQPYSSYFVSGYRLRGEAARKFQANYITIYSEEVSTPSIFTIAGQWDFSNSVSTGRWSVTQKITMGGGNYDNTKKRVKLRGHGVALQIRVESEPGEPFNIVGWSALETVNGSL